MLAAPGKYGFGTKIYLEGLGVGEVTDRGGAIVAAGKR
jgi:3D (Asp-Asp-Asp) domain-containing protein